MTIRNVDGSLRVENRHGPVNVSAITGDCKIKNRYGSIEVEAVGGKTEIENAHGPVDLRKLKGGADLSNRYGHIVCTDVEGGLAIDGKHSEVRGQNIGGDVQVATAYQSIELENVLGSINVKGQHGDITIKNSQPQIKPIVINAEYSGVDDYVAQGEPFRVGRQFEIWQVRVGIRVGSSHRINSRQEFEGTRFKWNWWALDHDTNLLPNHQPQSFLNPAELKRSAHQTAGLKSALPSRRFCSAHNSGISS